MFENLKGNRINIRGHHLRGGVILAMPEFSRSKLADRALKGFEEKRYGVKFGNTAIQFWTELEKCPDINIRLTDKLDFFCLDLQCPKMRDECSGLEMSQLDARVISSLRLELGGIYTVNDIREAWELNMAYGQLAFKP
jgi:hypothetical protein